MDRWEVRVTDEFMSWVDRLDPRSKALVVDTIDGLADAGPVLGRPLVDRLVGSEIHNLKELRPGSAGSSEMRNAADSSASPRPRSPSTWA